VLNISGTTQAKLNISGRISRERGGADNRHGWIARRTRPHSRRDAVAYGASDQAVEALEAFPASDTQGVMPRLVAWHRQVRS